MNENGLKGGGGGDSMLMMSNFVNEDARSLKDFKALISEKTVPKSISLLKKFMILLVLMMLGIAIFE